MKVNSKSTVVVFLIGHLRKFVMQSFLNKSQRHFSVNYGRSTDSWEKNLRQLLRDYWEISNGDEKITEETLGGHSNLNAERISVNSDIQNFIWVCGISMWCV